MLGPVQWFGAHCEPAKAVRHFPVPSHVDRQAPPAPHCARGSTPSGTIEHLPGEVGSAHDSHVPLHALSCHPIGTGDAVRWHDLLADGRRRHPDVPVRRTTLRTRPVDGLLAAAAHHDLLVVGAPRTAAQRRHHPGSVAHALTRQAACSVLVVPRPETPVDVRP